MGGELLRRLETAHYRIIGALYGCETEPAGEWVWTRTPHVRDPEWNHLRRGGLTGRVEGDGEADSIRDMLAAARSRARRDDRRPTIAVSSASGPHPLAAAFEAQGWSVAYRHVWHLHRGIEDAAEPPPAELVIRPVVRPPELDEFGRVFASVFTAGDQAAATGYRTAMEASLSRSDDVHVQHYLAMWNGSPAGTASFAAADGVAGLFNLGVLPAFRGRGIAAALTGTRVADIGRAGADLIYVLTEEPGQTDAQMRRGHRVVMTTEGWGA